MNDISSEELPTSASRASRVGAIAATIGLTLVLLLVAVGLEGLVWIESFNAAACDPPIHPCNYDMATASLYITPIVAILALLVTVALAIVFGRTGRRMWLAPIIGLTLVVIAFVVASILNSVATA